MGDSNEPWTTAKSSKARQSEWYSRHKGEFKQFMARLPTPLAGRFTAAIRAQDKTFQGWLREQAEEMTK